MNNNQLEEIATETVRYDEGTVYHYIYHLSQAIINEAQDPGMAVTVSLVNIPEGYSKFPTFSGKI